VHEIDRPRMVEAIQAVTDRVAVVNSASESSRGRSFS